MHDPVLVGAGERRCDPQQQQSRLFYGEGAAAEAPGQILSLQPFHGDVVQTIGGLSAVHIRDDTGMAQLREDSRLARKAADVQTAAGCAMQDLDGRPVARLTVEGAVDGGRRRPAPGPPQPVEQRIGANGLLGLQHQAVFVPLRRCPKPQGTEKQAQFERDADSAARGLLRERGLIPIEVEPAGANEVEADAGWFARDYITVSVLRADWNAASVDSTALRTRLGDLESLRGAP